MGKRLPFYSEKPYNYNYNRELKERKLFYAILLPIADIILGKNKYKMEVYGLENIPKKGGFIIAGNHFSGWDPITVAYAIKGKRQLFFMAKDEFFHTFYTKYPLLLLNGFPIKRGTADRSSLDFAIRVIREGFGLLIFPQGTRDKEHKRPEKGKSGVALIAREAKADVIPVSLHRESDDNVKRPRLIIRFGEKIPYADLGFTEGEVKSRELKNATKLIMQKIGELWDKDEI